LTTTDIGMAPTEPHFLEAISDHSTCPRYDAGQAKVPSPLIQCHRVITLFDVVGQREVPANIQIIPGEAETGADIPPSEKSDLGPRLLLLHLISKMQRQRRPSTKPNNVDRPIPFRKVPAQSLKRSGDSKRSSHSCHTTEKFSDKANPTPDSLQVKHSHIE